MFPLERASRSAPNLFKLPMLRALALGIGMTVSRRPYEYSLDLLSARAYTARNLRRKLVQRKFDPAEVEATVERLIANGLLDDRKFAMEFARQKLVHGGKSRRRVEQELALKGIPSATIQAALDDVADEETIDPAKAIERLMAKKLQSLAGLERIVQRRRMFGFLARRGFDHADVKRAIENRIP